MNDESKQRITQRIEELSLLLDGTFSKRITQNSSGLHTKKIVIEYDHHQTK